DAIVLQRVAVFWGACCAPLLLLFWTGWRLLCCGCGGKTRLANDFDVRRVVMSHQICASGVSLINSVDVEKRRMTRGWVKGSGGLWCALCHCCCCGCCNTRRPVGAIRREIYWRQRKRG